MRNYQANRVIRVTKAANKQARIVHCERDLYGRNHLYLRAANVSNPQTRGG